MDLNARNCRQLSKFKVATFYGQLLRIFCLTVEASSQLKLQQPKVLILAEIQPCKILFKNPNLDIHYFSSYGTPLVFDVTCIQSLVGRVKSVNSGNVNSTSTWAIIDRSGALAQAYYTEDGAQADLTDDCL